VSSTVELDLLPVDGESSWEASSTMDASVPEGATVDCVEAECIGSEGVLLDSEEFTKEERLAGDTPAGGLDTMSEDVTMAETAPVASVADEDAVLERSEEQLEEKNLGGPEPEVEVDEPGAASHKRLFTPEELDKLEEGVSIGASDDKEEYDKELEERLYPLDEVELQRRMKKNAERLKQLSLEEMSTILDIPVETLRRTQSASPGELSTPEYWFLCYRRTLAASEEARRANCDFKDVKPATGSGGRTATVAPAASDGRDVGGGVDVVGDEVLLSACEVKSGEPVEVEEAVVYDNIGINLVRPAEASPVASLEGKEDPTRVQDLPRRDRSLVRLAVYLLLCDELRGESAPCSTCGAEEAAACRDENCLEARATVKLVLLEPEIAAGRLCVVASAVPVYYEENAVSVRAKLEERGLNEDRGPRAPTTSPPKKSVSFECSSLFAERSEEFSARPPNQAEVDDLNQNAYVVDKCATMKRKPGLLEVPGCTAAGAGEEVLIPD
jgi:hypothetical protein